MDEALWRLLQDLSAGVHRSFNYVKKSTAVRSPIEHALRLRQGVCQDFSGARTGVPVTALSTILSFTT